jgi:threonyl-tRNA synthetase
MTLNDQNKLSTMRHSASHLMAMAVLEMFPHAQLAIGPSIENGFYYDFELDRPLIGIDLKKIEKQMHRIQARNDKFEHEEWDTARALKYFKAQNQPYKVELINDLVRESANKGRKMKTVSIYKSGKFIDLCAGPHIKSMKEIGPFELTSIAGAYWRGDEKNKMLQRIYGTSFETKEELKDYLVMQEEAKKRDHRKLGRDLDLFVFSDIVGKGLPMLTPKGTVIRKELEKFVLEEETKRGYQHVVTPPLAKTELYKKSGHYPYYKDTMYPVMKVDDEELILRPMTCPHHFMLYKSRPRSYKELPLKIAEISPQFRYEKSGELSGLTRARMFCLADAHIVCTKEQAKNEIKDVLDLIEYANGKLGFVKGKDYAYRLSLGDRSEDKKYYKDDKGWDYAEQVLREVLKEEKAPFVEAKGEASFYGPKIDIQIKKVNGQEETAFTVQYDFVMPKRFEMRFIDDKGKDVEPIVIHRSSIGAFERTMAFLIEYTAGAFPIWLAPIQAKVLTIGKGHIKYGREIYKKLLDCGIRAEIDDENETVGKKIRDAELQKIPYILVVGDKEIENELVAVRERGKGNIGTVKIDKFIKGIRERIDNKN